MKIIAGLGNPGKEYEQTRHNAGFLALDYILKDINTISCSTKFDAKINEVHFATDNGTPKKVLFVYPQTYMNDSGKSIKEILDFYKLSPADLLVLHDEVDLPLGTIKFTESSGSAGHNGIKSVIEQLGTQDFKRIRIGVESRENKVLPPTEAFVLQNFEPEEMKKIPWEDIKARTMLEIRSEK